MRNPEPPSIGLTNTSHAILSKMAGEGGDFNQMMDGYRFAVALALAQGGIADPMKNVRTVYGVSSLDPDRILYNVVDILLGEQYPEEPIYKIVERLAEWGIREMDASRVNGELDFSTLLVV